MQQTQTGFKKPKNISRKAAGIVSVIIALAIILTGTFAWSAVSQRATNPQSGENLPGGRVHDHFDGENKDVFAENFGTNPLFVRIQLLEFMEVNGLVFGEGAIRNQPHTWSVHTPVNNDVTMNNNAQHGRFRDYVTWNMGGQTWFMPTFNQRTYADRHLETDTSGYGIDWASAPGNVEVGDPNQTAEWERWTGPVGGPYVQTGTFNNGQANFWQQGDSAYEFLYYTEVDGSGNRLSRVSNARTRHYARQTNTATVMTMQQWIDSGSNPGNFWVVDADGWAYWAAPLLPGEATGLLLNGINIDAPMGNWYYAIHVVGEFADATGLDNDDWNNSDFGAPSDDAEDLLNIIRGVEPPATSQPPVSLPPESLPPVSTPPESDLPPVSTPPAGHPINDVPIGGIYVDDNDIGWRILDRNSSGHILIITQNVFGANALDSAFVSMGWNPGPADQMSFVSWDFDGPINQRLETIWSQIGADVRAMALAPNMPSSPSGGTGNASTNTISPRATTGRATAGTGGTGAMFHLSLTEANRLFDADNGYADRIGMCINGTARSWALRSSTGSLDIRFFTTISGSGGSNSTVVHFPTTGIRPAMWVNPN